MVSKPKVEPTFTHYITTFTTFGAVFFGSGVQLGCCNYVK